MPKAAASAQSSPAGKSSFQSAPRVVNPDRVGEELADDAQIWRVYDRVARQDDEERVQAWNRGFDNLALFATLFSAVTTAFLLEARNDMKPDYAELSFLVLNATNYGTRFIHQPFVVPPAARTINGLWTASLVLSLLASLISVMGKEWMTMYTARPDCNLRQWAEIRTYRARCIERWYMPQVVASTQPLLLHTSFVLFLIGLVFFIAPEPFTHHLTLGLCVFSGFVYVVTALSAIIFSSSPFKSPATQTLRTALSVFFSYLQRLIYRQERNPVRTLVRDINILVIRSADPSFLPGWAPNSQPWSARWRPSAILAVAGSAIVVYAQSTSVLLRTLFHSVQRSRVQPQLHCMASMVRRLPVGDLFLSSTWTDLPIDRRPKLVAEALSWLSGASQSPDIFRAIVFALGDLEVGPQVGLHTSFELRARLRAEIDRSWQLVDFLTLSRYVLADRNIPGDPALDLSQFVHRFDTSTDSALRCEDGLAARVKIFPIDLSANALDNYFPAHATQPRMIEFLLPHIQQTEYHRPDILILLAHMYRDHLWTQASVSLYNLEAHLYRSLDNPTRDAYVTEVNVKYGGTVGAVELLAFLCCHGVIDNVTKSAAVELIMSLLPHPAHFSEHGCLAYLFGSSELRHVAWPDEGWSSFSLHCLSRCLQDAQRRPFQPSSVLTQSEDRDFDLALARTSVMLLSPLHDTFGEQRDSIAFLFGYLCHPLSPSGLENDGQLNVTRLILESAALFRIVGMPESFDYDDNTVSCGTAILAAIISDVGRQLCEGATVGEGERLFQALALTEVEGESRDPQIWDLAEWLRTQAPDILKKCPSSANAMQRIHNALVEISPLCETNIELRATWDHIGYPGRPGDIFSDPFLNIGAFFDNAEAPRTRPGDIFDDPQWYDLVTEFFDGAEEGEYHWLP